MLHPQYRADIDGLRAIAVVSVVLFHAFPEWLPGGFTGVDVFFVISGYLITGIITRNLSAGLFSFSDFYARRVRRIFPALIIVLLMSMTIGWFILLPDELIALGKHVAGGAAFIANLLYWQESGYFDAAADTKPLLHLWSLGIEEQFYLVWPLMLWVAWRIRLSAFRLALIFTMLSFGINLFLYQSHGVADFFSPLSRFWELGIGALAACWPPKQSISEALKQFRGWFQGGALLLLAAGFGLIHSDRLFPGWWALIPTVSTATLLWLGNAQSHHRVLQQSWLVWLGRISYPLYLWHWPLLVYGTLALGDLSFSERAGIIVLSVGLAWLTMVLVESRLRFGRHGRLKAMLLCVCLLLVGSLGWRLYKSDGFLQRPIAQMSQSLNARIQWTELWETNDCKKRFDIGPCLISQPSPSIMILGDSHANHLYPGLTYATDAGVFAGGTCPPLLDVRMTVSRNQADHPCLKNDFVGQNLAILDRTPSIHTVIISAYWRPVLDGKILNAGERQRWGETALHSSLGTEQGESRTDLVRNGLARTIEALYLRGKQVILVRDNPELLEDIRSYCLQRFNLLQGERLDDCYIDRSTFESYRKPENALVADMKARFPQLVVVDPVETFCDATRCYVMREGVPYLRDQHHLSIPGSHLIGDQILQEAAQAGIVFRKIP